MSGWDFSSLEGRWIEEMPPWDFKAIITMEISASDSLLDIGTGGGEFLSSLAPLLPKHVYCTEGYRPNVSVARDNLRSLGVEVICTYCDDNDILNQRGALPFKVNSLDLVIDRHESFKASEVFRVLKSGGRFLTQQVGSSNLAELNAHLGDCEEGSNWNLKECKRQIQAAGFDVLEAREARLNSYFKDIGALTCFLLSAPWQVEGFTIDVYLQKLAELHNKIEKEGPLKATATRFYVKAKKT
jgi:SAM-dependent methyltransferase